MSKKYLIIAIVSLVLISGGIGLWWFLGQDSTSPEEVVPVSNPVVQKIETNTGVSEVVSKKVITTSGSGNLLSKMDSPDGTKRFELYSDQDSCECYSRAQCSISIVDIASNTELEKLDSIQQGPCPVFPTGGTPIKWYDNESLVVKSGFGDSGTSGYEFSVYNLTDKKLIKTLWSVSTNNSQEPSTTTLVFNDLKYKAYNDRITLIENGNETVLYKIDQANNLKSGEQVDYIPNSPELQISPDGSLLLFSNFQGIDNCLKNGLDIKSKKILWSTNIGCDAQIIWSPDNKQIAFVWDHFDTLYIAISQYGNMRSLSGLVQVNYPSELKKTKFYWESNSIFVFTPNPEYKEYISENFKKANLNLDINEFKTREDNTVSFSPLQVQEILVKIDENTKKQAEISKNATGVLIDGDLKAEYIAPIDYAKDTDKIIITLSGAKYELPGVYGEKDIQGIKDCTKLTTSIQLKDIIRNSECQFWSFAGFKEFSPSGNYLLIGKGGWDYYGARLIDVKSGSTIIDGIDFPIFYSWTKDKKQLIYGGGTEIGGEMGLYITKPDNFPETVKLSDAFIEGGYVDNTYIYVTNHMYTENKETKFLKIYDLATLKEVFSQEIK